ncbi:MULTISPECIES: efflux RND transporter periplasmic adaptor subunit [unclassified Proteus (in: enterobacteria)]|uniref:efflux RND transporter periplasmic adaptor subunit n=1 Tax=unclassified Proteus (in: enterobacteria) TaxID=257482 RepID=UPI0032DB557D
MTQSTLNNGIYYRMNLKPLYTLASAMMMISSLSACDEQTLELPSETNKPALTVEVTSPTTQLISGTVTANGNVGAWQEAIIGPEINGLRVEERLVQEGDWVQKGQPLL